MYQSTGSKVGKKSSAQLERIKKNIQDYYKYFKDNYARYNKFKNLVFNTSLSEAEKTALIQLNKPMLEFNSLEAFISRLRGEFAKYEPSIVVHAKAGKQPSQDELDFYENYIRMALTRANNDGMEYNIYTDTLSGGFSGLEVYTEYNGEKSFEQDIHLKQVFDPCLIGFDPLARLPHKGDGEYCYTLFPKTREEVEQMFSIDLSKIVYGSSIEGFKWSYSINDKKIVMLCDYFEKKKKKMKVHQLSNGTSMFDKEYNEFIKKWNDSGIIQQVPQIVQTRETDVQIICRYRLIENKILEYIETDFKDLPIVFMDGNSAVLKMEEDSPSSQMTRPYIYQAIGAQKLKNFAGQTLANALENMIQSKVMACLEGIPTDEIYAQSYKNPQIPSLLIYHAYNPNTPEQQLPKPDFIPQMPIPPEVSNTFGMAQQLIQETLGSYDTQIGNINESQLSGVAIVESASMGNATAMPFIVSFLQGLNQAAQVMVKLIPKKLLGARSIPVLTKEGKKVFVKVNQPGGIDLSGTEDSINVTVEAGVSFGIQKTRGFQQMQALMQISPSLAEIINTKGLPILLDNVECRGIEELKELVIQQQKQMANQPPPPNPQMMELNLRQQALQQQNQQNIVKNQISAERETTNRIATLGKIQNEQAYNSMENSKSQAEQFAHLMDFAVTTEDKTHGHMMDAVKVAAGLEDQKHQHAKDVIDTLSNMNPSTLGPDITPDLSINENQE